MLSSRYRPLCSVGLPFQGRQRYMHAFDLAKPVMAEGFEDYLSPVLALIGSVGVREGTAYMTVDEKVIEPGTSQRAPHPHVDGCVMVEKIGSSQSWWGGGGSAWANGGVKRMPIIVASSVAGCRVFEGDFDAEPNERGDMSHAVHLLGEGVVVPAHQGFLLSPDCVHESMIFDRRVERTFLRIALPVDSVQMT